MDLYKEFENVEKRNSHRQNQELHKITRKDEKYLLPYKNSCKKGVGEYFPSLEDKITTIKFLATHPTLPEEDKKYINSHLK